MKRLIALALAMLLALAIPAQAATGDVVLGHEDDGEQAETLPPSQQRLHVRMERSGRGGKTVTVVDNFVGTDDDLQDLGRTLKTKCGVGGSVKDGQIIIQGDFRERVTARLRDMGYPTK